MMERRPDDVETGLITRSTAAPATEAEAEVAAVGSTTAARTVAAATVSDRRGAGDVIRGPRDGTWNGRQPPALRPR